MVIVSKIHTVFYRKQNVSEDTDRFLPPQMTCEKSPKAQLIFVCLLQHISYAGIHLLWISIENAVDEQLCHIIM